MRTMRTHFVDVDMGDFECRTPTSPKIFEGEHDIVVSRLVARIAELEEQLYKPHLTVSTGHRNSARKGKHGVVRKLSSLVGRTAGYISKSSKSPKAVPEKESRSATTTDEEDLRAERDALIIAKDAAAEGLWEASQKLKCADLEIDDLRRRLADALRENGSNTSTVPTGQFRENGEGGASVKNSMLEDQLRRVSAELENNRNTMRCQAEEIRELNVRLVEALHKTDKAINERDALKETLNRERSSLECRLEELGLELEREQRQKEDLFGRLTQAERLASDYRREFLDERDKRRRLQEDLQIERGNIRVLCRVRPLTASGTCSAVSFPLPGTIAVQSPEPGKDEDFEFSTVFPPSATQEDVFDDLRPIVRSCADGDNACIIACGGSESGKTYVMDGGNDTPGIVPRAVETLLDAARPGQRSIAIAMVEIQNDTIRDLLSSTALDCAHVCDVAENISRLGWRDLNGMDDFNAAMREGRANRATASTSGASNLCKGHRLVFVRVSVSSQIRRDEEGRSPVSSSLCMVDLAGSENMDGKGASSEESQRTSQSPTALEHVITAIHLRSRDIPYKNSTLTQVLQGYLRVGGKMALIGTVSPEEGSVQDTLATLQFASRVVSAGMGHKHVEEVS